MLLRRLILLFVGLALYGLSMAMLVTAGLGLDPWDVLHQGIARQIDARLGAVVVAVSFVVLLMWIPLRQRPGFGTLANAVLIGVGMEFFGALLPDPTTMPARVAFMVGAVFLNGVATGMYIGAGLGPGPRDGLMTGIARRGHSIRVVRTSIELTVLAAGIALGGTAGVGTLLYAVAIGPLAHIFLPLFTQDRVAAEDRRIAVTADAT